MPEVNFTVESDADDWNVSLGRDSNNMRLLFSNPNTTHAEVLSPGYYIAQISIRGEEDKMGSLTISRPKFKDKVIKVTIDPGTGQGINLDSFRVI